MARDFQRSKIYKGEWEAKDLLELARKSDQQIQLFGSSLVLQPETKFGSLDAVQLYVDHVMDTTWYRRYFPLAGGPITVVQRNGNAKAEYGYRTMFLHDSEKRGKAWALRELVVLHELAHHVVLFEFGSDVASHGPEFAGVFLFLVEKMMGPENALVLRSSFDGSGVNSKVFLPMDYLEGVSA